MDTYGQIIRFGRKRGFGFVLPDRQDGESEAIWFHARNVLGDESEIVPAARVRFRVAYVRGRRVAELVEVIE